MSEKTILVKKFSREHSLFYMENWSYSEQYNVTKILGDHMANLLYLAEPGNPQVSSWYDFKELLRLFGLVAKRAEDPEFFKWVEQEFEKIWKKIEPYIKRKNKIKSISELKEFRKNVIEFYGPYTTAYVSPEISELKKEYRKISLKLREKVQEIVNDIDDAYLDFFINKFPQYQDIADYVTAEEVFSLEKARFSDEKLRDILERKEKGYFLLNNKMYLYPELAEVLKENNIELENYKMQIAGEVKKEIREFKGQSAYKGKVKGKVKIVMRYADINKVGEGDILVSSMTMPKYLPAMKKASAVITDEGGITSHAAIVAREMKKPAVVGAKIATKVLHDGDEVEVDANKGIVRIIKKAGN